MSRSSHDAPDDRRAVSIEAAVPADLEDVIQVIVSSRRTFLPYAPIAHGEPAMKVWMQGLLAIAGGVSLARLHGLPVGVLAISAEGGLHWIDQLYIAPGYTGMGIGQELLSHALQTMGRRLPIRLYTFLANTRARTFYERAGFEAIALSDGAGNEEKCADVLYELRALSPPPGGAR